MNEKKINKIILAYSGGLDTTVILHWLKNKYDAEVITFTADIGQEQDENHQQHLSISSSAHSIAYWTLGIVTRPHRHIALRSTHTHTPPRS